MQLLTCITLEPRSPGDVGTFGRAVGEHFVFSMKSFSCFYGVMSNSCLMRRTKKRNGYYYHRRAIAHNTHLSYVERGCIYAEE